MEIQSRENCSYGEAIEILYAQEVAAGLAAQSKYLQAKIIKPDVS